MRKSTYFNFLSKLIFLLVLLVNYSGSAQIHTPFTPRYNEAVKGDVTIIANNMISRTPTGDYNGNEDNHDFNDNVYVDIDSDNSTFNSSSANFSNPDVSVQCISIYKAYLYWAAADKEQDNGDDNQPNWNFDDIKIMFPGETAYTTMTADDVIYRGRDSHISNDPYVCFKDITSNVMALPNVYGAYQIANVEGKTGDLTAHGGGTPGTSGGWQIVFVYQSPDLPIKNITLFDGYAHVTDMVNDFDIDFSGFQTVPTGDVHAKVVIGSLEGDRDLFGDRLQIRDVANNFVDITAPLRDADNFFNSRITIGNNNYTDRNPASTNTLGFDAGVFQLDNPGNSIIANNQTATTLRLTSNIEIYGLFLLGLSIEVYAPDLHPTLITQTSGNNPANPGDILGFNINLINNGNDDATNVTYSTILPPQLTLSSVNNLPNGITYTYDQPSGNLVFNINDGLLDINDTELNIGFELEIKNECYFLEDNCDLSFDLQFSATYNGLTNPDFQTTFSTSDITSCDDLPLSININQPIVNWATSAGDLDTTVECSDTAGLNAAQALEPVPDNCIFTLAKNSGSFVPDSNCANAGTYTNSWNFTDACGNTIEDFLQTIYIVDTTPPTASNPPDINITCAEEIPDPDVTIVNDAADNCSTPVVTFVSDVSDNQTCSETIVRTYNVSDDCGNSISVTQSIIISDTEAPEVTTYFDAEIYISCEEIPEIPNLEFSDNCDLAVNIDFSEITNQTDNLNFDIQRTWIVTDECSNQNTFNQSIYVNRSTESNTQYVELCIEDDPLDLYSLVPYQEVINTNTLIDEWNSDTIDLLDNGKFDPSAVQLGEYSFINRISNNDCTWTTTIFVNVHDDCVYYPCVESTGDVTISKMVTPNNDGFNDFFEVDYILNEESNEVCDVSIKVQIYNRWGTKIFEANNYNNDWAGIANSTSNSDSGSLPTGTYYYIVELIDSGLKSIQGYIYLGTD